MEKLPPLTSPYTGGETDARNRRNVSMSRALPLCKGELEGGNLKSNIINLKFQCSISSLQINLTQPGLDLRIDQLRIRRQPSRLRL